MTTSPNVLAPLYTKRVPPRLAGEGGDVPKFADKLSSWLAIETGNIARAMPSGWVWPVLQGEVGVTNLHAYYGDVTRYGAVGDGTTDDAAAFTNALTSVGDHGQITVPFGTFRLASQITVRQLQSIAGMGNRSVLFIDHTGIGLYFNNNAASLPLDTYGPAVVNLRFSSLVANTPAALIANNFCQNLLIQNVLIDNSVFTLGIENQQGYLLRVDRVIFEHCIGTPIMLRASTGDSPHWTFEPIITGVDISHLTGNGIVCESAQGQVRGCVIESCTGAGLVVGNAVTSGLRGCLSVDSCHFENNTAFHIKSTTDASGTLNAIVTNGFFVDGVGHPSYIQIEGNWLFDNCVGAPGNTFSGDGLVRLRNCYGMSIGASVAGLCVKLLDKTSQPGGLVTETFQSTVNVNGSFGGGAALILCSHSIGSGNSTNAELFLIRYGFDGNNFTATSIIRDGGADNRTYTFSVDASGNLNVVSSGTGNAKYLVLGQMGLLGENGY